MHSCSTRNEPVREIHDGQKTVQLRQTTKILILHSAFNKLQNTLEFYQRDDGKIVTWLPYREYSDFTWQRLQMAVALKLKCKEVVLYNYCSNMTVPTGQLVSDVYCHFDNASTSTAGFNEPSESSEASLRVKRMKLFSN